MKEFFNQHPVMAVWLSIWTLLMLFMVGFHIGIGEYEIAFWQGLMLVMYGIWFSQNRLTHRSMELNGRLLKDLENVTKFAEGQQTELKAVRAENTTLKERLNTPTDKPVEVAA